MATVCRTITETVRTKVTQPVAKFVKRWKKECERHRKEITKHVKKPVERWVKKVEKECDNWFILFRWLCKLVVTLIKVVVWVVVTIIEVVYELVCKLVATLVRIIVEVVAWVIRTLSRLVCEIAAFVGSIFAGRLGYGIEDFIKGIGEIFSDTVETVTDLADDIVDSVASSFGDPGNLIGSIFKGFIQFVRSVGRGVGSLVSGWGEAVGRLLRLDLAGFLESFLNGIVDFAADVVQGVIRIWGAVFHWAGEESMQEIAAREIRRKFGSNPERVDAILSSLGYWGSNFGFPVQAKCYRLYLDSKNPDLWSWHNSGDLDLFALAHTGAPPFTDRPIRWWNQPRTELLNVDSPLIPVGRGAIRDFVDSQGQEGGHFRIFSQDLSTLRTKLNDTRRKLRQLGLDIDFEIVDIEIKALDEFLFSSLTDFVKNRSELQYSGTASDICERFPCVSAFYIDPKAVPGSVSMPFGFSRSFTAPGEIGGIVFRDRQPDLIFKWVPAHEVGHAFSLRHAQGGHRIMFSPAAGSAWNVWLIPSYLANGEPIFTLDEAREVWRYLVDELTSCFHI